MSVNKVILLGRLGKDPELKYLPSGAAVCNFSVATSEKFKDKQGEMNEKVEWHNCVAWGKSAETLAKYLNKGSEVYLEGKLATESYEKEGKKCYSTKVTVLSFNFVGGSQTSKGKKPEHGSSRSDDSDLNEGVDEFGE